MTHVLSRTRSRVRRGGLLAAALLVTLSATAACGNDRPDDELLVWTQQGGERELRAQQLVIEEFEKRHPGVNVQLVPKSGWQFTGDATALIAAVRGGTPPNVYIIDRFTTAQQASVGLFENLQPRIDAEGGDLPDEYLDYAIAEATYDGDIYGLPFDTDVRGLYYNKKVLRDAGVDLERLDPANGPLTVDEVMEIADQVTETDEKGNYTRMGLVPWDGQAFHATWALINKAQWYDPDTCEFTALSPGWRKTMEDFQRWSKKLGYQRVQAFLAKYRPPNQPPQQTPLFTGRFGMTIDGNWNLENIRLYAPKDFEFGVTYLPVPKKGDPPFTWGGGFALTMPKGAPNQDLTWEFMKFMAGEEGQRIYAKAAGKLPTWKSLTHDESVVGNQGIFPDMLEFSVSRPPLPVGAQVSDAMDTAQSAVLLGDLEPEEALQQVYDRVNPALTPFCPLEVPGE